MSTLALGLMYTSNQGSQEEMIRISHGHDRESEAMTTRNPISLLKILDHGTLCKLELD